METLGGSITDHSTRPSFINHVFSSTEEGKAEIYNAIQYGVTAIVPIVVLNKLVQRFIPDPDNEKGSIEILGEIILQLVILFVGIILIHRTITYIPTFSKYKYEGLTITNVILAFMIIILSLQTKIGIKTNILYERVIDLWEGNSSSDRKQYVKSNVRVSEGMTSGGGGYSHSPSQADSLDNTHNGVFPPPPVSSTGSGGASRQVVTDPYQISEPQPANMGGGLFGSTF
jgi:hypothetical protein